MPTTPRIPAQSQDARNTCWAACLIWQGRMVNRPQFDEQADMVADARIGRIWETQGMSDDGIGSLSKAGLLKVLKDKRFKLSAKAILGSKFTYEAVEKYAKYGPFILGYNRAPGDKHVNAVYEIDGGGNVWSMDPGFTSLGDDTYGGAITNRPLYFYKGSPELIVAYFKYAP